MSRRPFYLKDVFRKFVCNGKSYSFNNTFLLCSFYFLVNFVKLFLCRRYTLKAINQWLRQCFVKFGAPPKKLLSFNYHREPFLNIFFRNLSIRHNITKDSQTYTLIHVCHCMCRYRFLLLQMFFRENPFC